jgi:hypothetical protein
VSGYGSNLSNAPAGSEYDPYCPWNSSYIDDDAEELLEPQACVDCGKPAHPESEDAERCAGCELKVWQQGDNEVEIGKWEAICRRREQDWKLCTINAMP